MAYSILDEYGDCQQIRLVVDRHPEDPEATPVLLAWMHTDTKWLCDPCNPSSKRYEVTFPNNSHPQYYRWWEVVHKDDDEAEVKLKLDFGLKVKKARIAADLAQKEWLRLNG